MDGNQLQDYTHMIISVFLHLLFTLQSKFYLSDNCLECLLHILQYFVFTLQLIVSTEVFEAFVEQFPGTLYLAKKWIGINQDQFIKYVACPKMS